MINNPLRNLAHRSIERNVAEIPMGRYPLDVDTGEFINKTPGKIEIVQTETTVAGKFATKVVATGDLGSARPSIDSLSRTEGHMDAERRKSLIELPQKEPVGQIGFFRLVSFRQAFVSARRRIETPQV